MKCMVCGEETVPCVPLCFCPKCQNSKEAEAIRKKHREWFEKLVKERNEQK